MVKSKCESYRHEQKEVKAALRRGELVNGLPEYSSIDGIGASDEFSHY